MAYLAFMEHPELWSQSTPEVPRRLSSSGPVLSRQVSPPPTKAEAKSPVTRQTSDSLSVGSPVLAKQSGRVGEIIKVDATDDMPYKVLFRDGILPGQDWFKATDVQAVEASLKEATASAKQPLQTHLSQTTKSSSNTSATDKASKLKEEDHVASLQQMLLQMSSLQQQRNP